MSALSFGRGYPKASQRRAIDNRPPIRPGLTAFDADLSAIPGDVTPGRLRNVAELKRRNPSLYKRFEEDWEEARAAGRSLGEWRKQVARHLTTALPRARAGSEDDLTTGASDRSI